MRKYGRIDVAHSTCQNVAMATHSTGSGSRVPSRRAGHRPPPAAPFPACVDGRQHKRAANRVSPMDSARHGGDGAKIKRCARLQVGFRPFAASVPVYINPPHRVRPDWKTCPAEGFRLACASRRAVVSTRSGRSIGTRFRSHRLEATMTRRTKDCLCALGLSAFVFHLPLEKICPSEYFRLHGGVFGVVVCGSRGR